jgi:ribosomal-protein-alanine N-acetyltransferase
MTRFLTADDIESWSAFYKSPEAVQFLHVSTWFAGDPNPDPLRLSDFMIRKQLRRYAEQRYGLQMILEKERGTFLGLCGLVTQEVDGVIELEVGYHFFRRTGAGVMLRRLHGCFWILRQLTGFQILWCR